MGDCVTTTVETTDVADRLRIGFYDPNLETLSREFSGSRDSSAVEDLRPFRRFRKRRVCARRSVRDICPLFQRESSKLDYPAVMRGR